MITYLNGRLVEKNPSYIIVECSGIGYWVNITVNTYEQLSDQENVKIFTHFIVREDAQILYGFFTLDERFIFQKLLSVNGVGANTARVILSTYSPEEFRQSVVNQDVEKLKAVKGIGLKSAQRIIIELKDKLENSNEKENQQILLPTENKIKQESLNALEVLGFQKKSVEKVIDKILKQDKNISLEELIKQTLKQI